MDGKTHINIYSRGRTDIGQMLSNFYKCDVKTKHGKFKSVEGYWYWLGTRDDQLRDLWGYKAKKYGKAQSKIKHLPEDQFRKYIKYAITSKIINNNHILQPFLKSKLPFDHYYVYGGKRVEAGYEWITEHISKLRYSLKLLYNG